MKQKKRFFNWIEISGNVSRHFAQNRCLILSRFLTFKNQQKIFCIRAYLRCLKHPWCKSRFLMRPKSSRNVFLRVRNCWLCYILAMYTHVLSPCTQHHMVLGRNIYNILLSDMHTYNGHLCNIFHQHNLLHMPTSCSSHLRTNKKQNKYFTVS